MPAAMDSTRTAFPALPSVRGAEPRSVAHLAFPEILVIWALRRYTGCRLPREARAAVVAGELSRALGIARLEQVLAAFAGLADSLASAARLPQALSLPEHDPITPHDTGRASVRERGCQYV